MRSRRKMPPRCSRWPGAAVESGYELRSVVRELARLTRDLMVVKIDPSRAEDPEIAAGGGARAHQGAGGEVLAGRPDARLRRADEGGVRDRGLARSRAITSRWRCCAGSTCASWCRSAELIEGIEKGAPPPRPASPPTPRAAARQRRRSAGARRRPARRATVRAVEAAAAARRRQRRQEPAGARRRSTASPQLERRRTEDRRARRAAAREEVLLRHGGRPGAADRVEGDRMVFTFAPQHRALKAQLEQSTALLEELASQFAGRRMAVLSAEGERRRRARPAKRRRADAGRARRPPGGLEEAGARGRRRPGHARCVRGGNPAKCEER